MAMLEPASGIRHLHTCAWTPLARTVALAVALCHIALNQTLVNTRTIAGSGSDAPTAIAVDAQGNVYIAGQTNSPDFPVINALFPQLPEPALRVSTTGTTFANSPIPVIQVNSVAASTDGSVVLAATNSGLYRSTNAGAAWAAAALTGQILAVAVNPINANNAYAVALSTSVQATPASPVPVYTWTIFKSTDSGVTWQTSASYSLSPETAAVSRIIVNPLNPSILYVYINAALMESTDAGTTWQTITIFVAQAPNGGITNPESFAIAPSQPNIAYAIDPYGPFLKSTDGGATWQQEEAGIGSAGENAIAVDPQNPSTVWVVNSAGIQKSTDGGAFFQTVASMGDGSWQSIAISQSDSTNVFASDKNNVYASFDSGATWSIVASGQVIAVFATAGQIYAAASISPTVFLAKLDPTLTQVFYSTFLGAGSVSRIAVDSSGNVFLAGTTSSHFFPETPGAVSRTFASNSAGFLTNIRNDDGALLYSALFDAIVPYAIALDPAGEAVIVGTASPGAVPVTAGAFQSTPPGPCMRNPYTVPYAGLIVEISTHAFAAKLSADGSALVYATYVTGSCGDVASDVVVNQGTGETTIAGTTYSQDFPVSPPSFAPITSFPTTYWAGFVSSLNDAGTTLGHSTFVGAGNEAAANALVMGPPGFANLFVAGATAQAQPTPGAYQSAVGGCPPVLGIGPSLYEPNDHGFVWEFAYDLGPSPSSPATPYWQTSFLASIGGDCEDSISREVLDTAGNIWITGVTSSVNFPTVAQLAVGASGPGFLSELDPTGSTLLSSTVTANPGTVAAGPAGMVYFAEQNANHVLIAAINANQTAPITLDSIAYFGLGPGPGNTLPGSPAAALTSVAPGQAVRLKGQGIGPAIAVNATSAPSQTAPTLAGVQVTFNGVTAPLISVQANEIDCFTPFELNGATSAVVQVNYNGLLSNAFGVSVVPQNIDIFAVANQDGTVNSATNPAPINGVVTLYVTGAGQTNPPSIDGTLNTSPSIAPLTFPTVTLNTFAEQPVFVGAAVGQPAGVTQVNLFVPNPGTGNIDVVRMPDTSAWIYVTPQ